MRAAAAMTLVGLTALGAAPAAGASAEQPPAESREVRQLVTFRALPGQLSAVLDIYRNSLLPVYREVDQMRTVRVFGETESPEPLDLVVVTHYADMAAIDRANLALQRQPSDRPRIGELYRQISNLTLGHHDEFVEILSPPNYADPQDGALEVLEFLRLTPGAGGAFERQMLTAVHSWEQEPDTRAMVPRTETGRLLVADGWDYLRTYSVRTLGAWQAYTVARARHPMVLAVNRLVEARKTIILREMPDLRVR